MRKIKEAKDAAFSYTKMVLLVLVVMLLVPINLWPSLLGSIPIFR